MLTSRLSSALRPSLINARTHYTFPFEEKHNVDEETGMPIVSKKGKGVIGIEYLLPRFGVVAGKKPIKVTLEAGKTYSWCSCGHSQTQPFCDGNHKRAALTELRPVRVKLDATKEVMLCTCKQTKNRPYCDGTHMKLKPGKVDQPIETHWSHAMDEKKSVLKGVAEQLGIREKNGRFM